MNRLEQEGREIRRGMRLPRLPRSQTAESGLTSGRMGLSLGSGNSCMYQDILSDQHLAKRYLLKEQKTGTATSNKKAQPKISQTLGSFRSECPPNKGSSMIRRNYRTATSVGIYSSFIFSVQFISSHFSSDLGSPGQAHLPCLLPRLCKVPDSTLML